MTETSPILSLPYIQPAQAQKHVTHNEAVRMLDVIVQLTVTDRNRTAPPALPVQGDRHIVAAGATGDWAGQAGRVALYDEGFWQFFAARPGWQARVLDEGKQVVFDGADWSAPQDAPQEFTQVGINTSADAVNRLAVAAAATLLTHAGAGHQVKVNKAGVADTASLLFQTGFSGRAEMGLAGNDAFAIKTSADGLTFTEALVAAPATGAVTLPGGAVLPDGSAAQPGLRFASDTNTGLRRSGEDQIALVTAGVDRAVFSGTGLQLDVPLTGAAAQAAPMDAGADRVLKTGAGGLLGLASVAEPATYASLTGTRFIADGPTATPSDKPTTGRGHTGVHIAAAADRWMELLAETAGAGPNRLWLRTSNAGATTTWARVYATNTLLGAVSQAAGVPTGGVIERASNANGDYVRFADGTQICTRSALSAANASTATGSLFRSADVTWTFPIAFAAAPVVTGEVDDADAWLNSGTPGVSSCLVRAMSSVTKAAALNLRCMAVGRWF